jgi:hypothetical protein
LGWYYQRIQKPSTEENAGSGRSVEGMKEKLRAGIESIYILEEFLMVLHMEICSLMIVIDFCDTVIFLDRVFTKNLPKIV